MYAQKTAALLQQIGSYLTLLEMQQEFKFLQDISCTVQPNSSLVTQLNSTDRESATSFSCAHFQVISKDNIGLPTHLSFAPQ